MIRILRQRLSGLVLTLTLLIATVATGFGHQVMSVDDLARAQHALFWGQPATDVCGETGSPGTTSGMAGCAVCQLVSAALLPEPGAQPQGITLRLTLVVPAPARQSARSAEPELAHPVRAPPLA